MSGCQLTVYRGKHGHDYGGDQFRNVVPVAVVVLVRIGSGWSRLLSDGGTFKPTVSTVDPGSGTPHLDGVGLILASLCQLSGRLVGGLRLTGKLPVVVGYRVNVRFVSRCVNLFPADPGSRYLSLLMGWRC